ncbi:MAG TPA: hypothetical protein VN903_10015 [Polyangia bacterium]|nr:hypothetical protein [Polyangia bacterium]
MFRCQLCREVVPRNTRPIRRVVETRERQYPFRPKANRFKRKPRPEDPKSTPRIRYRDDPGGSGREIAREVSLCASCAAAAAAEDHHPRRTVRGPPSALAA